MYSSLFSHYNREVPPFCQRAITSIFFFLLKDLAPSIIPSYSLSIICISIYHILMHLSFLKSVTHIFTSIAHYWPILLLHFLAKFLGKTVYTSCFDFISQVLHNPPHPIPYPSPPLKMPFSRSSKTSMLLNPMETSPWAETLGDLISFHQCIYICMLMIPTFISLI